MSILSTATVRQRHSAKQWVRRVIVASALVTVIIAGSQIPAAANRLRSQTDSTTSNSTPRLAAPTKETTPSATSGSTGAPIAAQASNASVANPQSCQAISYNPASAIDLSAKEAGLVTVADSPRLYYVNGSNLNQIAAALSVCAPRVSGSSGFLAYTDYAVNWSYGVTRLPSGICTVTNVKVGMHISQIMPAISGQHVSDGVQPSWDQFIANLTTHESGHVAFDKQYAAQLFGDITNMPATDCATISTLVNAVIRQDLATLSVANENYDAATNHGETQGAFLR